MLVDFEASNRGWPYAETVRAGCKATLAEARDAQAGYWPTMDYMVENGRFGQARRDTDAIFALCSAGLTAWRA